MIKVAGAATNETRDFLSGLFPSEAGDFFECTAEEGAAAFLHRFATAGAGVHYRAVHDEALTPVGITLAQLSLMRNIDRAKAISVGDLGQLMELDRSTIGRNVRVLVKMGMANFVASNDSREAIIVISDEGHRVLEVAAPIWEATQRVIESKLGFEGAGVLL